MSDPDVLGTPYERETLDLRDDYEGAVIATLVRRRAGPTPAIGAVMHVHGFCDYFFQTTAADFFTGLGYDFYALDLRKYGRSLLPHQTPNFCLDLAEYDEELDAALDLIRRRDGHQRVVVSAHSTGGLVTSLWASRRAAEGRPVADAVVLNSPWLDLHGPALVRTVGTEALYRLGSRAPRAALPRGVSGVYVESLHRDHRGEWDFDLRWKPRESFAVRLGWLRAVRLGQRALHRGIDVGAPVLTLCSDRSRGLSEWSEDALRADIVLDVRQIARWSPALGPDVTVARVDGAMHDVYLSGKEARERAFGEIDRWLGYALGR